MNALQIFAQFLKDSLDKVRKEKLDLEAAKERLNEILKSQLKDDDARKDYVEKLVIKNGELNYEYDIEELLKYLPIMEDIDGKLTYPRYLLL